MSAHVLWFGPVSREQRAGATVEGAAEHFVSCSGDGAGGVPRCRAMAEGLVDAGGRHLPGLLRRLGIPEGEELFVGAFSAGGSAVKILLSHPDDRAAIRAVMLADATYELRGPDRRPASSPSLVAYAVEAMADGSRMFVATASATPNNLGGVAEPSGAETLERLAADIEAQFGRSLDQSSNIPGVDGFAPARVWRRGTVMLADLGTELRHAEHATVLAPLLWPKVLQPWISGEMGEKGRGGKEEAPAEGEATSDNGASSLVVNVAIAAAVATAVVAFWKLTQPEPRTMQIQQMVRRASARGGGAP
jgi:hypothetical protein